MMPDMDTFLVALYSMADDLCQKHYAPPHAGAAAIASGSLAPKQPLDGAVATVRRSLPARAPPQRRVMQIVAVTVEERNEG